jgi:hypothetical protein
MTRLADRDITVMLPDSSWLLLLLAYHELSRIYFEVDTLILKSVK